MVIVGHNYKHFKCDLLETFFFSKLESLFLATLLLSFQFFKRDFSKYSNHHVARKFSTWLEHTMWDLFLGDKLKKSLFELTGVVDLHRLESTNI
jgi:hypothetical protein